MEFANPAPTEGRCTYQESESGEETMKVILLIILFTMPVFMARNDDEQRTEQLVRATKVIVVAEVIEVGEAPGIWSGIQSCPTWVSLMGRGLACRHYWLFQSNRESSPLHVQEGGKK